MQLGASAEHVARRHGIATPAHAAAGREIAVAPVDAGSMRPQDCRRWQRLWCKRSGRSGRPARLLTGRDAAATLSSAATVGSSAASALPPEMCSALAMRLSNACKPLSTEATPHAHRRDPTPSRSQDGTRCTVSTATASRRRGPWSTVEPPWAWWKACISLGAGGRLGLAGETVAPRQIPDELAESCNLAGAR